MNQQDRDAIGELFLRLERVEREAPPRDDEADAFIRQRIGRQPAAPYFMAQTIIMQQYALNAAQERIEELERLAAERPAGGLFANLFGGGAPRRPAPARSRLPVAAQGGDARGQGQGGGFLAGAAQTAMGVAGGLLLGNMIAGMFAGDAMAAEADPYADEPPPDDDGAGFFSGDEF